MSEPETNLSPYRIPAHKTLIIVDAHGTVLKRDLSRSPENIFGDPRERDRVVWSLRDGFINFLNYFQGMRKKRFIISSDGSRTRLQTIFRRFGIARQFTAVYGGEHLHRESQLKQLDLIMREAGATPEETIFIGDSKIDGYSAAKYGVDFIPVPGDEKFSFNEFIRIEFTADRFGLEIQNITNARRVFRNLSTPELVEAALARGEGRLGHLGPLCVPPAEPQGLCSGQYIVREPSSETQIYQGGRFRPFRPTRFQQLYLRLLAFLQDRELFVQDSWVGADPGRRYPLRIVTQTAWHSLYARNSFIQLRPDELADFFPEYTIIHVPNFRAIPETDGTDGESFVILNMARKLALIGGTPFAGEIRLAAFHLLGFFFTRDDVLPVRCSSNRGKDGKDLSLFFGQPSFTRGAIALEPGRVFFGDSHHCWAGNGFFNLEWGCYEPLAGLSRAASPALFEVTRKFGTILENVELNAQRKIDSSPGTLSRGARASFPITHLQVVDRSGVAGLPRRIFILVRDSRGLLPRMARLTSEQAVLWNLFGFGTVPEAGPSGSAARPFFGEWPALFHPAVYALLFWEKLKTSGTECWLVNFADFESNDASGELETSGLARALVRAVHDEQITPDDLVRDETWEFDRLARFPGTRAAALAREADPALVAARAELLALFRERIFAWSDLLDRELTMALPGEKRP